MKESVRIIRFAIVGTLNALITALVVWLLMHIEGEDYITANVIAYIIAQIHNFIWCKYWIFPLETDDCFLPVLSCWRIQRNSFFF